MKTKNWETDPRPFSVCLKEFHADHGWTRDEAAMELRVPRATYDGWCDGRSPAQEKLVRRLMTEIDAQHPGQFVIDQGADLDFRHRDAIHRHAAR